MRMRMFVAPNMIYDAPKWSEKMSVPPMQNMLRIRHLWGPTSNTLIISYDVCHSSGQKAYKKDEECDEPSTVGFGFNGAKNPEMIIGDFHFQDTRHEKVADSILETRAYQIIKQYYEARGKGPDNVVILRDGVSEGQYKMAREEELPAIMRGIKKFVGNRKLTVAMVVVTKKHANRLFKQENGEICNVPPLTAVDEGVVRKNGNEVIFVAHNPVKRGKYPGTAQPIVLNVLHNDNVFKSNAELVHLMAVLCCAHQSSTSIISIPDTLFAADAYAKRGADLFGVYKKRLSTDLPKTDEGNIDWENITQKLCYKTSAFKNRRIA